MLVNIDFHLEYFIYGLFLTWLFIYINLPEPEIYEFGTEKFDNKCSKI